MVYIILYSLNGKRENQRGLMENDIRLDRATVYWIALQFGQHWK